MINGCEGRDARRSPKLRVRGVEGRHGTTEYRHGGWTGVVRRRKIKEEIAWGVRGSVRRLEERRLYRA